MRLCAASKSGPPGTILSPARKDNHMVKEMQVIGITIDPVTQSPIVILRDKENLNTLPIWIGVLEANAIAAGLENLRPPIRREVPIMVRDAVIEKALRVESGSPSGGEKDKWTELLEKMDPEDYSKYKM